LDDVWQRWQNTCGAALNWKPKEELYCIVNWPRNSPQEPMMRTLQSHLIIVCTSCMTANVHVVNCDCSEIEFRFVARPLRKIAGNTCHQIDLSVESFFKICRCWEEQPHQLPVQADGAGQWTDSCRRCRHLPFGRPATAFQDGDHTSGAFLPLSVHALPPSVHNYGILLFAVHHVAILSLRLGRTAASDDLLTQMSCCTR
jgi:hypothetical protein